MSLILSGTDGLSDVDGTAATPAIRGTDANTGIFFPAADTIAFAEGGVEAMRLDSSGNLGIGTSSPAVKLDVNGVGGALSAVNPPLQVWDTTALAANIGGGIAFGGNYTGSTKTNWAGIAGLKENATDNNYSGYLAFYTRTNGSGNAERARIDSSGNLGIGTTSPSTYGKFVTYSSGGYFSVDTNGQLISAQLLDVATAGGRLSGYSSRGLLGSINIEQTTTSADGGYVAFRTCAVGSTSPTERVRIDSSGNLLVGTTNASGTAGLGFKVLANAAGAAATAVTDQTTNGGQTNYNYYSTGAAAYRFYVGAGGTVFATSTSISAISDQTLKTNIRDLETGLSEVMALRPRRFDWKNGDGENIAGFVAQEVEQVLPELVTDYQYNEGETKKSLKMGDILPTLVKAIQEQQALIVELKSRISALEAK